MTDSCVASELVLSTLLPVWLLHEPVKVSPGGSNKETGIEIGIGTGAGTQFGRVLLVNGCGYGASVR